MGIYTEHWNNYKRDSVRWIRYLLLLLLLGLPFTAIVAIGTKNNQDTHNLDP